MESFLTVIFLVVRVVIIQIPFFKTVYDIRYKSYAHAEYVNEVLNFCNGKLYFCVGEGRVYGISFY